MTTFQTAGGSTLSYSRRGAGPLVVCVPGGPGLDPEAYYAPLDLPGYELLILAPRGTGRSTPPPERDGYRMAGYLEDVDSLRRHLGLETLTLYGHSHGGMVTLAYACAHPDRVERVLINSAPARLDAEYQRSTERAKPRFAAAAPDGHARIVAAEQAAEDLNNLKDPVDIRAAFRTLMTRYVVRNASAERAYLDGLAGAPLNGTPAEVFHEEMMGGLDLSTGANAVDAPALVMAGELDVTVPPEAVRSVANALANATYVEFPGVGHFSEIEAPETFTRVVTDFLGS